MHIEFLVEEPSAEAALKNLVPKISGQDVSFMIHPHQGKQDLLAENVLEQQTVAAEKADLEIVALDLDFLLPSDGLNGAVKEIEVHCHRAASALETAGTGDFHFGLEIAAQPKLPREQLRAAMHNQWLDLPDVLAEINSLSPTRSARRKNLVQR